MQVSLETTSGLERRLTITVPADRIESAVNKRLQQLAKDVRLDGFRPGKVPFKVVKRRYGAGARQEVLGDVIQSSFVEAVTQEKLNPAGAPSVEPRVSEQGKDFEYIATFEVYPEIELGDFTAITVEKPVAEVVDADIDTMLTTLREQNKQWNEVEREAAEGDRVTIDFKGSIDGEEFEGGAAEGNVLELGSGRMIPGFEDGIAGMKADEEKTITVTFPEDYQAENLKGKEAQFAIKLHKVEESALPEMNEEFFKQFGIDEATEENFRAEVRKNMERELKQAVRNKVKNQVMDGVLEVNELDVPKALVSQEVDRLREQAVQQWGGAQSGMDASKLPAELFEKDAERRVALGLLVGEIIREKELKADEDRVRVMIEEIASAYQKPEEVVEWYYGNQQQLSQVQNVVLEDQVVDTILEAAQVSDVTCSYEEAIRPAQPKAEAEEEVAEEAAESEA
ncbi:trigger factor [Endozoicomonadaceae bacterium StTr2]